MYETVEFRIAERDARLVLAPGDGTLLGDSVRKLTVRTDDPRYELVRQVQAEFRSRGKFFFLGWWVKRHYTRAELEQAELLRLRIGRAFEPAGEECGTRYDESGACPCGVGARQVGFLRLDLRRLPRRLDVARSIADEWVASQRFAELVGAAGLTGLEFDPVLHRRGPLESYALDSVPSGRELLARAERLGLEPGGGEYWVWRRLPWTSTRGHASASTCSMTTRRVPIVARSGTSRA